MSELVTAPPQPCPSKRSRAFTREVWRDRLARFPQSGLTPAQFCAIEAISLPSFYSWKRRLAAEAYLPTPSTTPRKSLRNHACCPSDCHAPAANLELVLPSGARPAFDSGPRPRLGSLRPSIPWEGASC